MAVQGLENMMKVNVIHFKRGPDTSKDKKKFNFVSDAEGDGKNSHAGGCKDFFLPSYFIAST